MKSFSDEIESRSSDDAKRARTDGGGCGGGGGGGGDGASIEVVRRRRGRPPGSKNKPKPPVIITREAETGAAMKTHVLEIRGGHDIVEALAGFSRRRGLGICVLAGSGAVSNVALRQPPAPGGGTVASTVVFRGRFEILSISAGLFPPSSPSAPASVSISLAGPQGQVVGGAVAGPLVAAGPVTLVAATFANPSFHRLPLDDNDDSSTAVGADTDHPEHELDLDSQPLRLQPHQHQPQPPHHHHHNHHSISPAPQPEPCSMSIYSSHLPSNVIWAPAARPPPPPPY